MSMKKIFTLLMAVVTALSISALPAAEFGKKADPSGRATKLWEKKVENHKQLAKALQMDGLVRKAMPKTTADVKKAPAAQHVAPVAKADDDSVIELNYDGFAGFTCYADFGEWWIGLECNDYDRPEYGHILQLNWLAPADNPCGTFTVDDMVQDYTYLLTPYSYGAIHFDEVTMTLTSEKVSASLERYVLDAVLVGDDGYTYKVHAVHENIIPKATVETLIMDAVINQGDFDYAIEGKNEDLDLKLVIKNYAGIIGSYNKEMIDLEQTKITYKGVDVAPLSIKAIVDIAEHTEDGSLAYLANIDMLGNDTVQYNILVVSPLPEPTDTIEVTCPDLNVDDSWAVMMGMVDFYASNSEFMLRGGWEAEVAEPGMYDAAVFLDSPIDYSTITSLQAQIEVSLDENENWVIEGTMLGDDNKVYNLHLSWNVPVPTDTVVIEFPTSAKAKFYPHMDNDLMLENETDDYYAAIDVYGVELGGEFTEENTDGYFTSLNVYNAESLTVAEIKNGKLYQVDDTTKIEADFVTFEGVLYQVKLWYVAPTPTETVNLDIKDAEYICDFDYSGVYNLVGYSEDQLTSFVMTMYATSEDDIPGTFINDGLFGKFGEGYYDFDAGNTFVGKWNADMEMYDLYYVQKGQIKVEVDEEKNILVTASVICEDAVQYELTMTSKITRPRLDFDAEDEPVDRVFDAEDNIELVDHTEDYGLIYCAVIDNEMEDMMAIYFVTNQSDADIVIPEGTYPINDTWLEGTVLAGSGVDWDGTVPPSYYAFVQSEGQLALPVYFFVEGTVTVTKTTQGTPRIEINAINSYEVPIHIVYDAAGNGLDNIQVDAANIRKQIINGQLYIIRDGKAYNAMGAQVK